MWLPIWKGSRQARHWMAHDASSPPETTERGDSIWRVSDRKREDQTKFQTITLIACVGIDHDEYSHRPKCSPATSIFLQAKWRLNFVVFTWQQAPNATQKLEHFQWFRCGSVESFKGRLSTGSFVTLETTRSDINSFSRCNYGRRRQFSSRQ